MKSTVDHYEMLLKIYFEFKLFNLFNLSYQDSKLQQLWHNSGCRWMLPSVSCVVKPGPGPGQSRTFSAWAVFRAYTWLCLLKSTTKNNYKQCFGYRSGWNRFFWSSGSVFKSTDPDEKQKMNIFHKTLIHLLCVCLACLYHALDYLNNIFNISHSIRIRSGSVLEK